MLTIHKHHRRNTNLRYTIYCRTSHSPTSSTRYPSSLNRNHEEINPYRSTNASLPYCVSLRTTYFCFFNRGTRAAYDKGNVLIFHPSSLRVYLSPVLCNEPTQSQSMSAIRTGIVQGYEPLYDPPYDSISVSSSSIKVDNISSAPSFTKDYDLAVPTLKETVFNGLGARVEPLVVSIKNHVV